MTGWSGSDRSGGEAGDCAEAAARSSAVHTHGSRSPDDPVCAGSPAARAALVALGNGR
ncbi:DUF397 domain-containing protein [Streptomyces barkulensis]|uniref:DUF397 domain-containing protein n=1 Tax=Streptomyces barkulensis TaxID=1257026 RepID=UPI000C6EEE8A|nr:DUF397 domain-containing protein [Streptomyces barkulensis]